MKRIFSGILLVLASAAAVGLAWSFRPSASLAPDVRADKVLVLKGDRVLELRKGGSVLKRYRISLGRNPVGAKQRQGDKRTPEGSYVIDGRNPASGYHLALHVSYPSAADRRRAGKLGVAPGGDIMVHGIKNGYGWIGPLHALVDWTSGCIAVTDPEIEEIWRAVPDGTPIEIRP